MENALEAVVKAIKCNKTVVMLVIMHRHLDLLLEPWRLSNEPPWSDGREQVITEALKSALENNTMINKI